MQADEVEAFEFFGGDLPVSIHTESRYAKRRGQPVGQTCGGMQGSMLNSSNSLDLVGESCRMMEHPYGFARRRDAAFLEEKKQAQDALWSTMPLTQRREQRVEQLHIYAAQRASVIEGLNRT